MEAIDEINQRPTLRSPDILRATAIELIKDLRDKEFDPDDEGCISSVIEAMRSSGDLDGYRICKELDSRFGWVPDAHMVDVMDAAFGVSHREHTKLVKEWVEQNAIRPRNGIGDKVEVDYRGHKVAGEITAVDAATATYTVMIPSLGHVKDGFGTRGKVVNFEQLHELGEPPEEFELRTQAPRG